MIQEKILEFFREKKRAEGLAYDTDLFKGKFIDSLFALEMVLYLEDTFHIKLRNDDINEENFRTIDAIAATVERAQQAPPEEKPRRWGRRK